MKKLIAFIITVALISASISIYFYIDKFGFGYFKSAEKWGAFGDFFGGVLNPTFTLLSIILLAYTLFQNKKALNQANESIKLGQESLSQSAESLKQNQKTLEINTKELTISSKALESSAEAQHSQAISNNFFNLLAQHNNIVNNLYIDDDELQSINPLFTNPSINGHNVFPSLINLLSEEINGDKTVAIYVDIQNNHNHIIGHYFRNLFQIIKYIDEYSDLETKKDQISDVREAQKRNFMRILRAQLSSDELSLLLINCLPNIVDEGQFRSLLIKYEMLKHVHFKSKMLSPKTIYLSNLKISSTCFNSYFNKETNQSAFGDNKTALFLRNETKN